MGEYMTDIYALTDDNTLEGVHLATSIPFFVRLTRQEAVLASGSTNEDWNAMCTLIARRTGQVIQGQIQIDYMTINGNRREFH
jgi:hypothetical protein